eukprot:5968254-Prymnesium_polylepis.1
MGLTFCVPFRTSECVCVCVYFRKEIRGWDTHATQRQTWSPRQTWAAAHAKLGTMAPRLRVIQNRH